VCVCVCVCVCALPFRVDTVHAGMRETTSCWWLRGQTGRCREEALVRALALTLHGFGSVDDAASEQSDEHQHHEHVCWANLHRHGDEHGHKQHQRHDDLPCLSVAVAVAARRLVRAHGDDRLRTRQQRKRQRRDDDRRTHATPCPQSRLCRASVCSSGHTPTRLATTLRWHRSRCHGGDDGECAGARASAATLCLLGAFFASFLRCAEAHEAQLRSNSKKSQTKSVCVLALSVSRIQTRTSAVSPHPTSAAVNTQAQIMQVSAALPHTPQVRRRRRRTPPPTRWNVCASRETAVTDLTAQISIRVGSYRNFATLYSSPSLVQYQVSNLACRHAVLLIEPSTTRYSDINARHPLHPIS
jgi:hypothetical protein